MFGLKLKSWMEAHLGRPRKSSSSSQKRSSKDSSSSSHSSTSGQSSSTSKSTVTPCAPVELKKSNSTTVNCTNKSSNGVVLPTRVVTASVSHSSSVLLGSFGATHNLSSPDTGYSTDGYSPKSAYPGLSFESCGKSTPKSSYTISSLVSCESKPPCYSVSTAGLDECLPTKDETINSEEKDSVSELKHSITKNYGQNNGKMKNLEPLPEDKCQGSESEPSVKDFVHENHRISSPWLNSPQLSVNFGGKNQFSSPSRKERPRIRTNPWITMSPLPKHTSVNHQTTTCPKMEESSQSEDGKSSSCEKEDSITSSTEEPRSNSIGSNTGSIRISPSTLSDSGKGSSSYNNNHDNNNTTATSSSGCTTNAIATNNRISLVSTTVMSDSLSTRNSVMSTESDDQGIPNNLLLLPKDTTVKGESNGEQVNNNNNKETDILSDWTTNNTDEENTDMDTRMSLSSCADDTDTGCRAMRFSSSQSNSTSVSAATNNTDMEVSDNNLTATYCASGVSSGSTNSSHLNYYYYKHEGKNGSTASSGASGVFLDPVCNMNLPTTAITSVNNTCYNKNGGDVAGVQQQQQLSHGIIPTTLYAGERASRCSTNMGERQEISHFSQLQSELLLNDESRIKNDNENSHRRLKSSHGLARGALGFIKKMFKKGSCSSSHTIGSPKFNKYECEQYAPLVQLPHAGIYGKGRAPSPTLAYPLSNRKTLSINNSFLTPTPNAFRRRSGVTTTLGSHGYSGPTMSSTAHPEERKNCSSSSNNKSVKTDIIRLPGTPEPHPQSFIQQHSKQLLQSSSESFRTGDSLSHHGGSSSIGHNDNNNGVIDHLNCTMTGKSVGSSSMSTASSSSATSSADSRSHRRARRNGHNKSHTNNNYHHHHHHESIGQMEENSYSNPISPSLSRPRGKNSAHCTNNNNCHPSPRLGTVAHNSNGDYLSPKPVLRHHSTTTSPCPYESPLLTSAAGRMQSPSVNNYSPIHRLVVTGGTHLLTHRRNEPPPLPPGLPPYTNGESPFLGKRSVQPHSNIIRSGASNGSSSHSPIIHSRHHDTPDNNGVNSSSPVVGKSTGNNMNSSWASPSPVLRNPRYQYITSSNQNSPVLNSTSRRLVHRQSSNEGHGVGGKMITFSPKSGQSSQPFCENESPNINHVRQGMKSPVRGYHHQSVNQYGDQQGIENNQWGNQKHVYANRGEARIHHGGNYPRGKGDLGHLNANGGILYPNRYASSMIGESEQIYETVDPVIEVEGVRMEPDNSDDGDGNGGDFEMDIPMREARVTPTMSYMAQQQRHQDGYYSSSSAQAHVRSTGGMSSQQHTDFRSRRSKESFERVGSEQEGRRRKIRPFDAFPSAMMTQLGTPLSETETRLLEADNDTDLRYKRLISEAEALLREISAQKSNHERSTNQERRYGVPNTNGMQRQQVRRSLVQSQIQEEFCPQSDPLRRKAYDCWALRRLQQELAGCCASPPVLHRSRMNLTSPSTPTGNNPFLQNLSLHQNQCTNEDDPLLNSIIAGNSRHNYDGHRL